jgi:hypothetical protein
LLSEASVMVQGRGAELIPSVRKDLLASLRG